MSLLPLSGQREHVGSRHVSSVQPHNRQLLLEGLGKAGPGLCQLLHELYRQ